MEHSTKDLIIILLKDILIFGLVGFSIFTIFLTNIYLNVIRISNEKIAMQDKYNMNIDKIESDNKIDYSNVPSYLYDYVNCLNNGIDKNDFSNNLNKTINDLNSYLKKKNNKVQLAYKDLNTGFHIGYAENTKVFAASTTKAPLAIYAYKLADEGKINLEKNYTYIDKYYANGTGIIKNDKVNTKYKLKDLISYSIKYSDNIAYLMISDIVKKEDASKYFEEKGALNLFNSNKNTSLYKMFGELSARDGLVYMTELYNYSLNNTKNSNDLLNSFLSASLNNVKEVTNKKVAHKYGWTDKFINDMALVYDENPYVITITSTLGNSNWQPSFKKIAKYIDSIHEQYWKDTKEFCINQLRN